MSLRHRTLERIRRSLRLRAPDAEGETAIAGAVPRRKARCCSCSTAAPGDRTAAAGSVNWHTTPPPTRHAACRSSPSSRSRPSGAALHRRNGTAVQHPRRRVARRPQGLRRVARLRPGRVEHRATGAVPDRSRRARSATRSSGSARTSSRRTRRLCGPWTGCDEEARPSAAPCRSAGSGVRDPAHPGSRIPASYFSRLLTASQLTTFHHAAR